MCPKKVSGRWGYRPLVGIGVMEVQTLGTPSGCQATRENSFSGLVPGAAQGPESEAILPAGPLEVDRPQGSFNPSTKVPQHGSIHLCPCSECLLSTLGRWPASKLCSTQSVVSRFCRGFRNIAG